MAKLRSQKDTSEVVWARRSYKTQRVPGWANTNQSRDLAHSRRTMSDRDTVKYFSADSGRPAKILKFFFVTSRGPAKFFKSGKKLVPSLRALGLSRNHILADSQVAILLRKALVKSGTIYERVNKNSAAIDKFVRTLAGSQAKEASEMLTMVLREPNNVNVNDLITMVSMGDGNVRIGDSVRNEHISSGFDEETDDFGKPTVRSNNVREALHGLAVYSARPSAQEQTDTAKWAELVFSAAGHTMAPTGPGGRFKPVSSSDRNNMDLQEPDTFKPSIPSSRPRYFSI
jgi:hypothetical protein